MHVTIFIKDNLYKKISGEVTSAGIAKKEQAAAAKASDAMVKAMLKTLAKMDKKLWDIRWQGILEAYQAEAAKRGLKIKS